MSDVREFLDKMAEIGRTICQETREWVKETVEKVDDDTRLAVAAWVFDKVVEHATKGGSYRTLIYERLGFGPEAYGVLQLHGGLEISNEFDLRRDDEVRRLVREHRIDVLKPVLYLCDEPGCFGKVSCGWPEEETGSYRRTCGDHYHGRLRKTAENSEETAPEGEDGQR
jgi:hypothetical protein